VVADGSARRGDLRDPRRRTRRDTQGNLVLAGAKGREAMIYLEVEGIPAAQGSKRHVGNGVMVEMSKRLKPWRKAVMDEVVRQGHVNARLDYPLHVRCVFYFKRPKHHYYTGRRSDVLRENAPDYVTTTPDIDKLLRSTYDALTQAGVLADDKFIVAGSQVMEYSNDGWVGAKINVMSVDGE
jgi:Holliday junction resolvase RusA-like endonuclease